MERAACRQLLYFAGVRAWAQRCWLWLIGDKNKWKGSSGGHLPIIWCCRKARESVGIKTLLWAVALKTSFGHASHYIFVFVADVTLVPPVQQQQQNKSYILPPQYNRGLLALIFSQCVFEGPCAHILRRKLSSTLSGQGRPGSPPSLFTWCFFVCWRTRGGFFARHRPRFFFKICAAPFPRPERLMLLAGRSHAILRAVRFVWNCVGIGAGNARQRRPGRRCSVG